MRTDKLLCLAAFLLLVATPILLLSKNDYKVHAQESIEIIDLELPDMPRIDMPNLDGTELDEFNLDELSYLACCIEAEAGNQSLLGKRLVADVILNRVESELFPDTIIDVINQPGQFAVVVNGTINVAPSNDSYKAAYMELNNVTDTQILYFTSVGYIGEPCYKLDAHYFGK